MSVVVCRITRGNTFVGQKRAPQYQPVDEPPSPQRRLNKEVVFAAKEVVATEEDEPAKDEVELPSKMTTATSTSSNPPTHAVSIVDDLQGAVLAMEETPVMDDASSVKRSILAAKAKAARLRVAATAVQAIVRGKRARLQRLLEHEAVKTAAAAAEVAKEAEAAKAEQEAAMAAAAAAEVAKEAEAAKAEQEAAMAAAAAAEVAKEAEAAKAAQEAAAITAAAKAAAREQARRAARLEQLKREWGTEEAKRRLLTEEQERREETARAKARADAEMEAWKNSARAAKAKEDAELAEWRRQAQMAKAREATETEVWVRQAQMAKARADKATVTREQAM